MHSRTSVLRWAAWALVSGALVVVGCKRDPPGPPLPKVDRALIVEIHHRQQTQKSVDVVKRLLAQGAKIDIESHCPYNHWQTTPLIEAIRVRDEAIVELLLARGARVDFVNPRDSRRRTALHYAVDSGQYYVIEMLLARGPKLDGADYFGQTPLHLAAASDKPGLVKLLLQKGAQVNALDRQHRTPLDYANYESIRTVLLQAGGKRGRAFAEAPSKGP